jgi:DNA ligase-1
MHAFAVLLDKLYYTYSHLEKTELLKKYFAVTPDPDRGFALAIISGQLSFKFFKRTIIRELISERIDNTLFDMSYDYVGDLSETVALLWPQAKANPTIYLPSLTGLIAHLNKLTKAEMKTYLAQLLDSSTAVERWALLKVGTGGLRIGVSARFIKQVLAQYGQKDIYEIEQLWHGIKPPYTELFSWLENKSDKPAVDQDTYFHPVMLAHPLDDKDLVKIDPAVFFVEKKFDGIRVQLVSTEHGKAVFSRTGDDISTAFPDSMLALDVHVVLDGELVIKKEYEPIASFNQLQQRLNRKSPTKKMIAESPAHIILYDILKLNGEDLRGLALSARRQCLEKWFSDHKPHNMSLSELLIFDEQKNISALREEVLAKSEVAVEGLMLKRKDSVYLAGRPTGYWYKWKRDPYIVDAILMYAQRGHGKRSSFYSDFTFGLWQEDTILPIGKAYFGFTDAELKELDKWVRQHTTNRFGPVTEVEKLLVLEIAFEAVNVSPRHKSGFALRFPRVSRIRWDKPANEADRLESLKKWVT